VIFEVTTVLMLRIQVFRVVRLTGKVIDSARFEGGTFPQNVWNP
jgi:hypothetical protein